MTHRIDVLTPAERRGDVAHHGDETIRERQRLLMAWPCEPLTQVSMLYEWRDETIRARIRSFLDRLT